MSNLEKLNEALAKEGIDTIKDTDPCPERTAYLNHLDAEREEGWGKKLKMYKEQYILAFHTYVADVYPHLLYEIGEDKTYWNYHSTTGVYEEINFSTVRGLILDLLIQDQLHDKATEGTAKAVLARYRAMYTDRGHEYDDFDTSDDWFHAANGWVQVHTLKFEPHTPERLSRRVSDVVYDAEATCPNYDAFLDTQMKLKKDQVRAIDQFSGLLLTPDISRQKMLVLIGKPGCGKSTLLDAWSDVLGDCATQKGLTEISSESFRFGGSTLAGKRLCWFDEVEVTRSNMGNSLINLITGQHIRVERKGINGIVDVDNHLKCVLTANTLPRSAEMGIYRRMILIYLTYSFYDDMTANHDIRNILKAEASGILNRMLRGLADVQKHNGFTVIEGHDDLIEDYKTSSNTVAEFLEEYFDFDYDASKITSKVLLEAYQTYASDKYTNTLTPARFGVMLNNHGLSKFKDIQSVKGAQGVRMWAGLKLKDYYELNPAGFIREKEEF